MPALSHMEPDPRAQGGGVIYRDLINENEDRRDALLSDHEDARDRAMNASEDRRDAAAGVPLPNPPPPPAPRPLPSPRLPDGTRTDGSRWRPRELMDVLGTVLLVCAFLCAASFGAGVLVGTFLP